MIIAIKHQGFFHLDALLVLEGCQASAYGGYSAHLRQALIQGNLFIPPPPFKFLKRQVNHFESSRCPRPLSALVRIQIRGGDLECLAMTIALLPQKNREEEKKSHNLEMSRKLDMCVGG